MIKNLQLLFDRIIKEHPQFGNLEIKLVWHEGRFVRYDFIKTDSIVIKEIENDMKNNSLLN